jgi:segregation and condensation protein A
VSPVRAADLDLDLDVFAGPFDLLLTLVLREEVDLLEVDLADVVVTYVDWLEARGELDLELATEFLVLIAALLELKSRLMLPGEEQELLDLEPGEAAEELLARLLEAHRYRGAAEHLRELLERESGHRFRSAPLPPQLRRSSLDEAGAVYEPATLGRALGGLLRMPAEISLAHVTIQRVTVIERLRHLRSLLSRGRFSFDEAVARADRVTVAVTIWALLELYKRGEATWEQDEPFADIQVEALAERPWPDLAAGMTGAEAIRSPHVEPAAGDHHAVAADEPEADEAHSAPLGVPA